MSFSITTAEMMGVDFVARCLASYAHTRSRNGSGLAQVTIISPLIFPVEATPQGNPDHSPMFTKDWVCDPKYVFNGAVHLSYGNRMFNNMPASIPVEGILPYDCTRIVVGSYYGCPIIISTDRSDCRIYRSYTGAWAEPCPEEKGVEYNGFKWYYSPIGYGNEGVYQDNAGEAFAYTGTLPYEQIGAEYYPTQEGILDILTLINPTAKE